MQYSIILIHILLMFPVFLEGFVQNMQFKSRSNNILKCALKNTHSYLNKNVIINNQTNHIAKIYTTYDNKNTLIVYKNGSVHEHFNKTVKMRYIQDVIHLHIVSNRYFEKLYQDLKK